MSRADCTSYQLASALAANGSGPTTQILGGNYIMFANGTIGGGTLALQVLQPDGTTWGPLQSVAGTGSAIQTTTLPFGATQIYLPAGNVRVTLTGATAPNINAWLVGIG